MSIEETKKNAADGTSPKETALKSGNDSDTSQDRSETQRQSKTLHQMESGDRHLRKSSKGESEVEMIAKRTEERRASRVAITLSTRKRFLHNCRRIAIEKGYDRSVISGADLHRFRNQIEYELEEHHNDFVIKLLNAIGLKHDTERLLEMLNKASEVLESYQMKEDDFFYYQDFNFYYTRVESRYPWLRSEFRKACLLVFLYYFFTPILFCHITSQESICQGGAGSYEGWMSSLYFASTTISTVGYGDLSVSQDPRWRSLIGIIYMVVSMLVAIVAFTAAANHAFSPIADLNRKFFDKFLGDINELEFLHQRVRRVKFLKYFEIACQFSCLNLVGVFASRFFFLNAPEDEKWTWMTSFYWSVQTTTTIGYGDLDQPFDFRWFKIFYLTMATYAVGNSLGKLGELKSELEELRRRHAWESRKVTKRFIREMQADETDDKVDQYEFLVASLLNLNKLSYEDVVPIMDKFRELAKGRDYISVAHDAEDDYDLHSDLAFEVDQVTSY